MLVSCAMDAGYGESGCTREGLMTFLQSDELRNATFEREAMLKRRYRDASGAPFFVIEGLGLAGEPVRKLSGAQPTSVFSKVFRDLVAAHQAFVDLQAQKEAALVAATADVNAAIGTVCAVCGNAAKSKCSRCKTRRYCSPECQKRDWATHKESCVAPGEGCEGGVCAL